MSKVLNLKKKTSKEEKSLLLESALQMLKERPEKGLKIFLTKYKTLVKDERLLEKVLSWEWSEETYKSLCYFISNILLEGSEYGLYSKKTFDFSKEKDYEIIKSTYCSFCYLGRNIYVYLPFMLIEDVVKEGFELLKIYFEEGHLKDGKLQLLPKNDKRFMGYRKRREDRLISLLKDERALTAILSEKDMRQKLIYLWNFENFASSREDQNTDILPIHKELFYCINKLSRYGLPFKEFEDLAEEGFEILKSCLRKNKYFKLKEEPSYKEHLKKVDLREREILSREYKKWEELSQAQSDRSHLRKYKEILNKESIEALRFFSIHGRDVLQSSELLIELLEEEWNEKTYNKLDTLSYVIRLNQCSFLSEERNFITVNLLYYFFYEYWFDCYISFATRRLVPFHELEEIGEEYFNFTKVLLKKRKLHDPEGEMRQAGFFDKSNKLDDALCRKGYVNLQSGNYY